MIDISSVILLLLIIACIVIYAEKCYTEAKIEEYRVFLKDVEEVIRDIGDSILSLSINLKSVIDNMPEVEKEKVTAGARKIFDEYQRKLNENQKNT